MRLATTLIVALAFAPLSASSAVQRARYLMGTVCEVAVPDAADAGSTIEDAFAEASRIEAMLSTWKEESALSRLNRENAEAPPELRALLNVTIEWSRRTNRAFDPRIKTLVDLWRTREEGAWPDRKAIANALAAPQAFEEGAFGKGYAIDRMLARIDAREAMIDFGGQIAVRGSLRATIADPENRRKPVLALTIAHASLSTSSGSEKTFEIGGRRFSHIIDPRTGEALPPRGSVSVLANDALTADILSTALYVMGEDEGLRWADANGVAAIFINSQRNVRRSARARERVRDLELLDRNFKLKD